MKTNIIHNIDCLTGLKQLPDNSIDCIVTSPPYWALRDYGVDGQLGLEKTFTEYIDKLLTIFDECKRVLTRVGTCWVNLGDTYNGSWGNSSHSEKGKYGTNRRPGSSYKQSVKNKSLCMIPERFSIGMIDNGWILRNQIIWHKPSCMPSSVKDRFTVDFEKMFFFVKNKKYYFEQQFDITKRPGEINALGGNKAKNREYSENDPNYRGGHEQCGHDIITGEKRNRRTVWNIATQSLSEAHFAVYPEKLIETPIIAGCPVDGVVLDPFMGAGTTALVALKNKRQFIGFELNSEYIDITNKRIKNDLDQGWIF